MLLTLLPPSAKKWEPTTEGRTHGRSHRKTAAAADIIADGKTTLTNARAKGGTFAAAAEARLAPVMTLAESTTTRLTATQTEAAPKLAELDAADIVADKLIGKVDDDLWNLLGRPAHDPAFDILFPGGIRWYTDGDVMQEPERMELLAELLESGVHPRLVMAPGAEHPRTLRDGAAALRAKVDAARPYATRIALGQRMVIAIAHSVQLTLSRLKRLWLSEGMTEAQVHEVIPDRPASRTATPPAGGGGGGAPPGGSGTTTG